MFKLDIEKSILCIIGSVILSFGLYNVHDVSGVTEGGILGLTLLIKHWFNISPAITGFFMNMFCYVLGFKLLGKNFVKYSIIAGISFSLSYALFENFPQLFPQLLHMPYLAAFLGAIFVGVGAGLCIRGEGAPGGDDALAMVIVESLNINIKWTYFLIDIFVLVASLSYLDLKRVLLSLLSVILSGQIVGEIQDFSFSEKEEIVLYK